MAVAAGPRFVFCCRVWRARSFLCCRCAGAVLFGCRPRCAFFGSRPRDRLYFAVVAEARSFCCCPGFSHSLHGFLGSPKAKGNYSKPGTGSHRKGLRPAPNINKQHKQYPEKRRIATSRTCTSCTNNEPATLDPNPNIHLQPSTFSPKP